MTATEPLTLVIERIGADGEVISTDRSTTHGWASPAEAVAHWKANSARFQTYRNGRVVESADTGSTRAYFEGAGL